MANKKRILITGVSGLLGSNLGFYWKDQFDVLGIFNTHPVKIQGIQTKKLDLLSEGALHQTVKDFKPDVVIHSAALADIDGCEDNKELAQRMNVRMVTHVVNALVKSHAKLIYISSDAVYDGSKKAHQEDEKVAPANYYGMTKYLGELEAFKHSNAMAVRTAFYGWNIQDKLSFAQQVVSKLSSHQGMKGFTDVYTSLIYTFDLADLLFKAIQKDLKGIYNFGCQGSMSKYDFAVAIAKEFKLDQSLIEPTSIDNFELKVKRAKYLGLSVDKLSDSLKEEILPLDECIQHFYNDFKLKIPGF